MTTERERRERMDFSRLKAARARQRGASVILLGFFCGIALMPLPLWANPTGADVVAGTAAVTQTGNNLNVVNSNGAIINWQSFSIGSGEVTSFLQPSAASSVLNRVVGGNISAIYGTLQSNGQVYLINPNGIMVGASGMINTAGFVASTLDVSNAAFSQYATSGGTLSFLGSSAAKVQNLGTITADGGNVFLIAQQVDNQGTIRAARGTAGLYAGSEVYLTTGQADAGNVQVTATSLPNGVLASGVSNSGVIEAVQAELKATGNMYALAINNTGAIRATGASVGQHGVVHFVSMSGTVKNSGTIVAKDAGGQGGSIETSGKQVDLGGTIQTGKGGSWLIDPATLNIDATAAGTIVTALNGGTDVLEQADSDIAVNSALAWNSLGTLTLQSGNTIEINSAISAMNGGLTLNAGGTIAAAAAVNVGTFTLASGNWVQTAASLPAFHATNFVLSGGTFLRVLGGDGGAGAYQIADVYGLQGAGGFLNKNFLLANDIDATGTAQWNGGAGFVPIGNSTTAYSGTFNGSNHTISNLTIDRPTEDYAGLFGVTNGATIENVGLVGVNVTGHGSTGGLVGAADASTINNTYTTGTVTGTGSNIGGLIGYTDGTVEYSYSTATVSGDTTVGGLIGGSQFGTFLSSYATGAVSGNSNVGGLGGVLNWSQVNHCYALGSVTATGEYAGGLVGSGFNANIQNSYSKGHVSGNNGNGTVGGLIGHVQENDYGYLLIADYWDTDASGTTDGAGWSSYYNLSGIQQPVGLTTAQMHDAANFGYWGDFPTVWYNAGNTLYPILQSEYSTTITNSHQLELVGMNATTLAAAYTLGNDIDLANDPLFGAAGFTPIANYGLDGASQFTGTFYGAGHTISNLAVGVPSQDYAGLFGYVGSGGVVEYLGLVNANVSGDNNVGGLAGRNDGTVTHSYETGAVTGAGNQAGGLVGWNNSHISYSYATGTVTGAGGQIGGLAGYNAGIVEYSYALEDVSAAGSSNVGGLVGENDYGSTLQNSYAAGTVSGATNVGGVVGWNSSGTVTGTYYDASLMTGPGVGSGGGTATGLTTAQMMNPTSALSGLGSFTAGSGQWCIAGNGTYAVLQSELTGTVIQNSHQLELMGMSTNLGGSYTLANDIDLAGDPLFGSAGFVPIGGSATPFTGTFDGVGHTIDHLTISLPAQVDVGLFGVVSGTLKNAVVSNVSIIGSSNVGGLVGYLSSGGVVTGSQASGSVSSPTSSGANVGGLVGKNAGAISYSHATANITSGSSVGGLVGYNSGTISHSDADGVVDTSGSGNWNDVGGLAGDNIGSGASITYSHASTAVTGNINVGGLVGGGGSGDTISNSYATGTVVGIDDVGGLLGTAGGSGDTLSNSYATGNVSGAQDVGGLVGQAISGTISNSYATGAVSGSSTSIGGLVGYAQSTGISDSYAAGAVTGSGTALGGLVGTDAGSSYTNNYWESDAAGTLATHGIGSTSSDANAAPLALAQMAVSSNFSGFDFTQPSFAAPTGGAWGNDPSVNGGLPYLQWQHPYVVVVPLDRSLTYNGLDPYASAVLGTNYSVYVSGVGATASTSALLAGTPAFSGSSADAGSYAITISGISLTSSASANNTLAFSSGTETIAPATLTVTLGGSASKTYDRTPTATLDGTNYILTGIFGSDDVAAAGSAADYATVNVGTGITITASGLSLTGTKAGDYVLSGATASGNIGEITPKAVDVTVAGTASRSYDGTTTASQSGLTYGLSGFFSGDDVAVSGAAGASYGDANVGTGIAVTASGITLTGAQAGNYSATSATANIGEITPATLTVSLQGTSSKTYDGTTAASLSGTNYSLSGVFAGDIGSVAAAGSVASYASANVGTGIGITANGLTLTGAKAGDYALSATTASGNIGEITAASLVLSANDQTKIVGNALTFGGTEITAAGLQNGETAGVAALSSTGAPSSASTGSYDIVIGGVSGGTFNPSNYSVSYVNGTLTVNANTTTVSSTPPEVSAILPTVITKVNDGASTTPTSAVLVATSLTTDTSGAAGGTDKTVGTGSNGDADTGSSTGSGKKTATLGGTTPPGTAANPAPGTEAVAIAGTTGMIGAGFGAGAGMPPFAVIAHFDKVLGPTVMNQLKQALR